MIKFVFPLYLCLCLVTKLPYFLGKPGRRFMKLTRVDEQRVEIIVVLFKKFGSLEFGIFNCLVYLVNACLQVPLLQLTCYCQWII